MELKPCPFCGGSVEWNKGQYADGRDWHYLACSECEAMGSCNSNQREGQILDWNTRATDPDTVTIKRSELEEALVAVRIANIKTYGGFVNITKILETALEKK
jgi:Lar family restriction alleviation protein